VIKRDFFLNQIIDRMWDGRIKVITGIRRCGKLTLLFTLFKEYLVSTGVDEKQIIEIELDKRKFYMYRNPIILCEYVEKIVTEDKSTKYYLFMIAGNTRDFSRGMKGNN